MLVSQIGTFKIPAKYLRPENIDKYREALRDIFSKAVVLSCWMEFVDDSIHYQAYSEYFEEVPEGHRPYDYTIAISSYSKDGMDDPVYSFAGFFQGSPYSV